MRLLLLFILAEMGQLCFLLLLLLLWLFLHVDDFLVCASAVDLRKLLLIWSKVAGNRVRITLTILSSSCYLRPLLSYSVQFVRVLTILLQQLFHFWIGGVWRIIWKGPELERLHILVPMGWRMRKNVDDVAPNGLVLQQALVTQTKAIEAWLLSDP